MIRLLVGAVIAAAIGVYVHLFVDPGMPRITAAFAQQAQGTTDNNTDRRQRQLEERERALDQREALLKAAEQRLNEKIAEMRLLQSRIEAPPKAAPAPAASAVPAEETREEQFRRLARVYGNMRPRDAAKLLESMEQALLIELLQRMRDFKLGPILAAMDPKKAAALTGELSKRRPPPRPDANSAAGG